MAAQATCKTKRSQANINCIPPAHSLGAWFHICMYIPTSNMQPCCKCTYAYFEMFQLNFSSYGKWKFYIDLPSVSHYYLLSYFHTYACIFICICQHQRHTAITKFWKFGKHLNFKLDRLAARLCWFWQQLRMRAQFPAPHWHAPWWDVVHSTWCRVSFVCICEKLIVCKIAKNWNVAS